jgi:hypothetical protein
MGKVSTSWPEIKDTNAEISQTGLELLIRRVPYVFRCEEELETIFWY